jgi:hypothetical protein
MRTDETHILPFADHRALKLYGQFESVVCNALGAALSTAGALSQTAGRPCNAVTSIHRADGPPPRGLGGWVDGILD